MKMIREAWVESRAFRVAVRTVGVGLLLIAFLGNPMALTALIPMLMPRRKLMEALES